MIKDTGGRRAVGHAFWHKSGQTGGSSPFHGRWPPLKHISMIDNEYIKEIMTAVREDSLECMRTMCNDREIAVNRTLNSVSFKCL